MSLKRFQTGIGGIYLVLKSDLTEHSLKSSPKDRRGGEGARLEPWLYFQGSVAKPVEPRSVSDGRSMPFFYRAFSLVVALLGASCEPAPVPQPAVPLVAAPYAFDAPTAAFILPSVLGEVSGLAVLDERHLGAVQDEDGDLYVIDVDSARIVSVHDFGKKGDYEGIERLGDRVYVLRSDGRLFEIADWHVDEADADGFDSGLHGRCDAEGLAAQGTQLLIACKESAGKGRQGERAIFAFDPTARILQAQPAYTVHADSFGVRGESAVDERVRELVRPLADINAFKPAALAVHPMTEQLYIVSSVRKLIVVLETDGTLSAVWPLPEHLFRQPEGLAFLADGTLFIANEASGGDPTLLRFSYRPAP